MSKTRQDGWRDISTAPCDGTRILACVYHPTDPLIGIIKWVDTSREVDKLVSEKGNRKTYETRMESSGYFDPEGIDVYGATHWQPLPAPPGEQPATEPRECIDGDDSLAGNAARLGSDSNSEKSPTIRDAFAWLYQWAGAMIPSPSVPSWVLDNLSALASGKQPPHKWEYPAPATEPQEALRENLDREWTQAELRYRATQMGIAVDPQEHIPQGLKFIAWPQPPLGLNDYRAACGVLARELAEAENELGQAKYRLAKAEAPQTAQPTDKPSPEATK